MPRAGESDAAAAATLAETGILSGGLRVPNAAAPIEVTADLRASRIRRSMTVDAPNTGRATTRLDWLLRQLRDSKGQVCIEATAVRQRGKGAVRTLAELRETPKLAIDDPARELRAFIVSLSANAGTKRGTTANTLTGRPRRGGHHQCGCSRSARDLGCIRRTRDAVTATP